jgi:hypothetical protein
VRILGYGFREEQAAWRARDELTEQYKLGPHDTSVARLAGDGVVLAIRATDDNIDGVTRVLAAHGGERLTDVDERWTQRRPVD